MKTREKLTYLNDHGESAEFSPASIYHANFKDVAGLSDIRNAIYSISSMGQDGDTYLGNRIISRDIEIIGHINERDKARAAALRRRLNKILNPQVGAKLIYENGSFKRLIDCTIDNAPVIRRGIIFEQFTIQLSCLNPFWREEHETRDDIASWIGLFEFPVRGEDDKPDGLEIPDDEGWEIGYREPSLIVNVFNGGDVRAGLRVEFRAMGEVIDPSLFNVYTREFIKLNMLMLAGDVLTVITGYGQKRVTLRRAGIVSDAFRYLDVDSIYLQLDAGDNLFRYDAEGGLDNLEVSIYHNNFYLGV